MKKKEKQSLRSKTPAELVALVEKAREDLAKAMLSRADAKNTNAVKNIKRTIATIMTILSERTEESKQSKDAAV